MVSSRDRNCQRSKMTREVIARAPPPAFLFPNQQCQRPRAKAPRTASQRNHPFSARCRRRRLSIQPRIPCQTVFRKTVRTNPPNPPESKPSRPKRPSSRRPPIQSRKNFQETLSKLEKTRNELLRTLSKSSGAAPSSESQTPCQSRISLNFSKSSKLNTSPNLGILVELFASVRSGASSEASLRSQPTRFHPFEGPKPQRRDKKGSLGRRGCPPGSVTESIGARNLTKTAEESKSLAVPAPAVAIAFPSEGRI
jgi:hypothetical protein